MKGKTNHPSFFLTVYTTTTYKHRELTEAIEKIMATSAPAIWLTPKIPAHST
jgi:hypothetical protein